MSSTIKKKVGLGRGLGALLENANTDITTSNSNANTGNVAMISISSIEANPWQPRSEFEQTALNELTESIRVHGVIQPITVRKMGYDRYQLISGERRTRASLQAGLTEIPAFIRVANDQDMLEMALIENIQRSDLDSIEIALSYQRWCSLGSIIFCVNMKRRTSQWLRQSSTHSRSVGRMGLTRSEFAFGSVIPSLHRLHHLAQAISVAVAPRQTRTRPPPSPAVNTLVDGRMGYQQGVTAAAYTNPDPGSAGTALFDPVRRGVEAAGGRLGAQVGLDGLKLLCIARSQKQLVSLLRPCACAGFCDGRCGADDQYVLHEFEPGLVCWDGALTRRQRPELNRGSM